MSKKAEIKVYLPYKLVGQLETRRQAGIRSKFIQKAIERRLENDEDYDIEDEDFQTIIDHAVYRLRGLRNRDSVLFPLELSKFLERVLK
ncbi:MAG: hypothetical protein ACTSWQ_07225 [Candidatus Thorarchaeota archaeon]